MTSLLRSALTTVRLHAAAPRTLTAAASQHITALAALTHNTNTIQQHRQFASERLTTIKRDLISGLEDDIRDLADNTTAENTQNELNEFVEENEWKLTVDPEQYQYYLTKHFDGTQITVSFDLAPDEYDPDSEYDEHEGETGVQDAEDDENDGDVLPHSFHVDIKPAGQFVRVYAGADRNGSLTLSSLVFDEQVANELDEMDEDEGETSMALVHELRYDDLIEPVQDTFRDFLEELGIDDRLALFVQQYTHQQRTQVQIEKMKKLEKIVEAIGN